MSIASNLTSGPYVGNGSQTAFAFTFTVAAASEIRAQINGVDVSSSTYTVALNADGTGTLTFSVAPANGATVLLISDPSFAQETIFESEGDYSLDAINAVNRRDAVRSNWLAQLIAKVLPTGWETISGRAGKFMGWDAGGNPISLSGTGNDSALRTDLAASGGSLLVGFLQAGTGGAIRTAQAKLREQLSATDFSTVQQALTRARAVGGDVSLPAGTYSISSTLTIDYAAQTQEPVTQPLGVSITGDGAHSTVISRTGGSGTALDITGGTGVASHVYTEVGNFSVTGSGTTGIKLKNLAFANFGHMTIQGVTTCLNLESVLSCRFENIVLGNSTTGVTAAKGTGFSDINANYWDNCTFRLLTNVAYGGGNHSGIYFNAVNVEGCGTHANAATGGFDLTFTGAEGSVGLTINGGYFEGNAGGWDINLTNTGSEYVTHTLTGVNFNRTSSSSFVTNNIRSVGKNRIVLIGCTFDHFNTYTPSAGRLYVNADANTQVICIGCKFKSATEQGTLRNLENTMAGSFDSSGTAVALPSGWSVSKTATGTYDVTHNLNLATSAYVVNAVSEAGVTRLVQRIVKGLNKFTIVTQDGSAIAADSAVGFNMTVLV